MCIPKERGGTRHQGQLWCPARNSLWGRGQRNVLQGQRAAQAHPALRTPRRHWMQDCIYGWRLLQQNNYSQRKAGVVGRSSNFHWIFHSSPKLSVGCGKKQEKNLQRSADIGTWLFLKVKFFERTKVKPGMWKMKLFTEFCLFILNCKPALGQKKSTQSY